MPSTFSPNLRIELIAPGEQSNTWGITTNNNLGTLIEQAISGLVEVDVTAADVELTALNGETDQSRNMMLKVTGTPDAERTLTAPAVTKIYTVINDSTKPVTIISSAEASVGVKLGPDGSTMVYCDGTNFYKVIASGANAPVGEEFISLTNVPVVSNLSTSVAFGDTFTYTPVSSDSKLKVELSFSYVLRLDPPVTVGSSYMAYFELYDVTSGSTFIGNMGYLGAQAWTTTYNTYDIGTCVSSAIVSNTDTTERTFQLYVRPGGPGGKLNIVVSSASIVDITEVPN